MKWLTMGSVKRGGSSTLCSHAMTTLADFSSCEISDALVKLGVKSGGLIPDIDLISPEDKTVRICGPAYTVQMVLGSDTSAPKLSSHFVDTAPAGSVIVIAAPPRSVCSPFSPHKRR